MVRGGCIEWFLPGELGWRWEGDSYLYRWMEEKGCVLCAVIVCKAAQGMAPVRSGPGGFAWRAALAGAAGGRGSGSGE